MCSMPTYLGASADLYQNPCHVCRLKHSNSDSATRISSTWIRSGRRVKTSTLTWFGTAASAAAATSRKITKLLPPQIRFEIYLTKTRRSLNFVKCSSQETAMEAPGAKKRKTRFCRLCCPRLAVSLCWCVDQLPRLYSRQPTHQEETSWQASITTCSRYSAGFCQSLDSLA